MWIISEAIGENSKFMMIADDIMKLRGNGVQRESWEKERGRNDTNTVLMYEMLKK